MYLNMLLQSDVAKEQVLLLFSPLCGTSLLVRVMAMSMSVGAGYSGVSSSSLNCSLNKLNSTFTYHVFDLIQHKTFGQVLHSILYHLSCSVNFNKLLNFFFTIVCKCPNLSC